ncbi:hypothetical protein [Geminocystis sp. GBBB08]|uniref:hypothetical protein n=1 Tax=Geminocystis sp. GBBB08 TaxID=2604140 RepID=UPI0027E30971|nr:hypothetical protein [Geminocystis sp. GBBB08]
MIVKFLYSFIISIVTTAIILVISLPQTAFTATGAGVKSSVLFLRKYPYIYHRKN